MNDTTRNAHIAERRSMLRTELQAEALMALSRGEGVLREFRTDQGEDHNHVKRCVIKRDLSSMLRDMLDDVKENETESVLMRALVNVFQHSDCCEVASWRLLFASIYSERADDIADMEAGE
jgi:hypothetical protein